MKFNEKLEKFITNVVKIIFLAIIIYLISWTIGYTCRVDIKEITYYEQDSIIRNVLTIIISIAICILIAYGMTNCNNEKKKTITKATKRIAIIIAVIWTIFSIVWILSTQLKPRADQRYCLDAAKNIVEKNYSDFEKGAYMDVYPDQSGIVLFMIFCGIFLGKYNYVAIQLLNVVGLIVSYYYIYKICNIIFKERNRIEKYIIIISMFLYIQMAFYTTFVYGNIFGLMFSLIGIYYELAYFEDNKILKIIISFLCISLAIIMKANYLVTLLAMLGLLIYEAIFKRKYKSFLLVIGLIAFYVVGNKLVVFSMEKITNRELSTGVPKLAWIEMGLQEGGFASGWYNGYNKNIYLKNDCDKEKTGQAVKEDFKNTINEYSKDLNSFGNYITEKIVSQWVNPTFQCFWINQNRKTNIDIPKWAQDIIKEEGSYKYLVEYMDIMQTIILFGTLFYITNDFKKIDFKKLIFAIIFIGGFLFHILWEAKCQYTITYFILLIPYSVIGYSEIIERVIKKLEYRKTQKSISKGE